MKRVQIIPKFHPIIGIKRIEVLAALTVLIKVLLVLLTKNKTKNNKRV